MAKRIITEADVYQAHEGGGSSISAPPGECIITPKARDKALELNVSIDEGPGAPRAAAQEAGAAGAPAKEEALVGEVVAMMRSRLPAGVGPEKLEGLVREVVGARLAAGPKAAAGEQQDAGRQGRQGKGVFFVDNQRLMPSGDGLAAVPGKVIMAEAMGATEKLPMAAGYMQWEKASFSRTMDCVEICIVLEGRLHLTVGGENLVGKPGDMIYLPKGVNVIYSTPETVKLACVNCLDRQE